MSYYYRPHSQRSRNGSIRGVRQTGIAKIAAESENWIKEEQNNQRDSIEWVKNPRMNATIYGQNRTDKNQKEKAKVNKAKPNVKGLSVNSIGKN